MIMDLLSLSFNYQIKKAKVQAKRLCRVSNYLNLMRNLFNYDYTFDMAELELKPGDEVSYYFEVYDNDGVNGSKSARTNLDEI